VLISEVWGGFSPEAMRFLGELAQARNDGIDIERASTTWSTSSFTSYHGQDHGSPGRGGVGNPRGLRVGARGWP
jgi:hypothetical protein